MRDDLGRLARSVAIGVFILASGAGVVGCSSGDRADDVETVGKPVEIGAAKTGSVTATGQRTDGSFVLIDDVTLAKAGYVAVYADGNGAPGRLLGASALLQKGTSKDVRVKVSPRLTSKVTVHVMLHAEDNKNNTFEFPKHDAPVTTKGAVLETPIKVEVKR